MIERLTDYLIKRRLNSQLAKINSTDTIKSEKFKRVCNTLKKNKIAVITRDDGIYIRFAGGDEDEHFSYEFHNVCKY